MNTFSTLRGKSAIATPSSFLVIQNAKSLEVLMLYKLLTFLKTLNKFIMQLIDIPLNTFSRRKDRFTSFFGFPSAGNAEFLKKNNFLRMFVILFAMSTTCFTPEELKAGGDYDQTAIAFNWTTPTGTLISSASCDDCTYGPFNIGFTFNYFGVNYTQFYVSTNGILTFGAASSAFSNVCLPNTGAPSNMIAAYWDDLYYNYGCSPTFFYYNSTGGVLTVSWVSFVTVAAGTGNCSNYVNTQIKLYQTSNNVEVHVQTAYNNNGSTIGIQNTGGTIGYQEVCSNSFSNGTAWRWTPCTYGYDVAAEGASSPAPTTPSGCGTGQVAVGSGANRTVSISPNTYYNLSWSSFPANINEARIVSNGTGGTVIGNNSNWNSGTSTSMVVKSNRSSCSWVATSAVLTYNRVTPATPSAITGTSPVCNGSSNTYSVTNVTSLYNWTYPGGTPAPSSTTNSVTFAPTTSGTLTVFANNDGCVSAASSTKAITVNTLSTAPTGISGTNAYCEALGSTALTATGGTTGTAGVDVWYTGACGGSGGFEQDWGSQPYTTSGTTVNSITNGVLNVTSTNGDPMILMHGIGTFAPATYKNIQIRYKVTAGTAGTAEIFFTSASLPAATGGYSASGVLISDNAWHTLNIDLSTNALYNTIGNITGWRFDWSGNNGVTMDIDFIHLGAGVIVGTGSPITVSPPVGTTTYYVNRKGACNSTTCASQVVTVYPYPVFTTTPTNILCNGASTGSILVNVTTGTSTFDYSKTAVINYSGATGQTSPYTFSSLPAGSYDITVRDAHNCVSLPVSTIVLTQPSSLPSFTETHTAVLCNGGSTGTITVTASGGTAGYTYSKNGTTGPFQASNVFTGLAQGSYSVRVKDANGCETANTNVSITQPTALSFTSTKTDVVCFGDNNGTITLNGAGGVPPYQYSDDNGGTYNAGTDPYTFSNLAPNTYLVGITDANSCPTTFVSKVIAEPAVLSFTTSQVDILCNGNSTGSITVTATGGTGTLVYSRNGGSSYQSSNIFSGLAAGTYSIKVKDANLCVTAAQSVTINEPASLPSFTETHTAVLCNGGSTGTITVTASGGTPGYTYSKNGTTGPFQSSNVFTGLAQGSYSVRVKDANGCETANTNVSITQPPVLSFTSSQTNVVCNGNNDGTITLDGSGGVTPYQYSKDNGSNYVSGSDPYTFSSLVPATYLVGIKDANNCPTTFVSLSISEPSAISFSTTQVDVLCNGDNTGSITVSATGGSGTLVYSRNGGTNYQASNVFNNLVAGNYSIVVKDGNNCITAPQSVTINEPVSVPTFTETHTPVICNGGSTGTITVTASGGTPGYTYSNDAGSTYQVSNVFTGLSQGTYQVKVKDANDCTTGNTTVSITQPTVVSFTNSETDVVCNGDNNGTITLNGSGGVPPYTYSNDNGSTYVSGSDPYTFTGLSPAAYEVGIKDANDCATSFTTVTVNEPAAISFTTSKVDVLCFGNNTGSITVSASGGTGTLLYSKNGGTNYQVSNVFNGLVAGTYTILVKDANICITSPQSVTINQPAAGLSFTTSLVHVLCNGDNTGSITVNAAGGTPGYTYSDDNGSSYQVSNVFNTLSAGTYLVKVKDASGCTTIATNTNISQPTLVTYTTSFTNVNCNGVGDGTITIDGNGGVPPYQYSINNGATFQFGPDPFTFNNLAAGTYLAGLTDDNGCVKGFTSITIIQPTAITFTTSQVNVFCYGGNNASITVTASGGTGVLTYSKDNGSSFQASNVFTGLVAGTYQIKVKDASGCVTSAQSVTITQPTTALTVTASNGGPYSTTVTASLFSSPSGGTPTYTYNWSGPASFATNPAHTLQNPTRTPTTANMTGTYKVTVTDANGCSATAQTVMNVFDGYVWIGAVSTDWNNNSNWNFQVPDYPDDCTQKAYIQAGTPFAPNVNIPGLTVGALTLAYGATVNLDNDLTLCSNLTGSASGTLSNVTGNGKLIMRSSPSVVQNISGSTKFDATLQVDNSAGVNITSGASQIINALELKAGVLTVGNPNYLTFMSNSSNHSAIIDNFSAGMTGSISGSVKMQRKYDAPTSPSYKTQHYMGSPVDQPPYTAFGANGVEGRVINTLCDEKKAGAGSPYGSMAKYDENWPDAAICNLQGWYIVKTGNTENGRGYSVARSGAGVLSLTGVPNQAANYTRTSLTNSGWTNITVQGHRDTSGWHILSNPWLANLSLNSSGGAGMDNQVAVWQTTGPYAGGYHYYQVGFEPVDIAPFQAFLVHKTSVGGLATYTINGSDRVRTPSAVHFNSMNNDQELAINVDNTLGLRDRTVVAFNTQATDNFDPVYDGNKLWGDPDRLSLYSENNAMPMARNTLTSMGNNPTVPMGFDAGLPGSFTMSFEGLNSFDATCYIMLEDKQTNAWHNVRNGNYVFSGDTTDNLNRFVLHFTPAAVINHTDASCNTPGVIHVEQAGNANWNYVVTNISGTQISNGSLNSSNPITVNAAPGVYTLTLVDNHNYTVVKQIQVSGAQGVQASFVASATAVEQDDDITFTSTSTNATNHVWNFGDNNTANGVTVIHSYTAPGVYSATLTADNTDCNGMSTQQITVAEKATTGVNSLTDKSGITIWSNDNTVYVDFGKQPKVEAQIEIYNVLGQQLSNEKYGRSSVYHKQFNNLEAAYVIVRVKNNDEITTKKVFIGAK